MPYDGRMFFHSHCNQIVGVLRSFSEYRLLVAVVLSNIDLYTGESVNPISENETQVRYPR